MGRSEGTCAECGRTGRIEALGLCKRCYTRQYREKNPRVLSEAEKAAGRERMKTWAARNPERHNANTAAFRARHPEKSREYARKYRESLTPEQRRAIWIKCKYRLTDEQYADLLTHPNECAACGVSFDDDGVRRHIDHDHGTGAFRGLLCGACNQAAGMLRDSPERADQLATYLRRVAA